MARGGAAGAAPLRCVVQVEVTVHQKAGVGATGGGGGGGGGRPALTAVPLGLDSFGSALPLSLVRRRQAALEPAPEQTRVPCAPPPAPSRV